MGEACHLPDDFVTALPLAMPIVPILCSPSDATTDHYTYV